MPINRWMDKEGVVHIHNGILSHKRNAFESVLMKWMNLLYRVKWVRKRKINIVFWQASTWISHRYTYIPFLLNLPPISLPIPPIYITICKIDSQREFASCLRKLKQGLCINLEGWDGEGDGKEVQKGVDICILMADSCWGFDRKQNPVKQLSFNKKIN